jgi:putative ABC transport system ATP-binding protein
MTGWGCLAGQHRETRLTILGSRTNRNQIATVWQVPHKIPGLPLALVGNRPPHGPLRERATTMLTLNRPPSSADARPTTAALKARGLTRIYGQGDTKVVALRAVDVDILAGQFTAIMGPSGSGKSTLMHCLAGLDSVTSGTIHLGDTDLTALDDTGRTLLRRDRIGFVFQSLNLLPAFTARQNMVLPLDLAGRRPDPAWLSNLVAILGLADRLEHRPAELSGGQQQRVAIARALLPRPDVVFADEPTGNLDSRNGQQVLSLLREVVHAHHQTVVMVTHDPLAAAWADRVLMLADGEVVHEIDQPTPEAVVAALARIGG